MAQKWDGPASLPDTGGRRDEGQSLNNSSGALNQAGKNLFDILGVYRNYRVSKLSTSQEYMFDLRGFVNSADDWNGVLMRNYQGVIDSVYHSNYVNKLPSPILGVGSYQAEESNADIPSFLTDAAKAVRSAKIQLEKAQEQLKQAEEVEQAMLELAQLREVRKAHNELYGPDKPAGLTAAQEYLAFKKNQREQQSTPQQHG